MPETGSAAPLEGDTRGLPFQWSLLAWAALVGILTGVAVVGFHYLLGFINNFLFGTLVEWVLDLVSSQQLDTTTVEVFTAPDPDSGTPLKALLQLGLGGVGFLPPPPPPLPEPTPLPPVGPSGWLASWPVVIAPLLGGVAVGLLRQVGRDLGPSLPSLMAMADGGLLPCRACPDCGWWPPP